MRVMPARPAEPPRCRPHGVHLQARLIFIVRRQSRRARLRTLGKTRALGCALYKLPAQSLQP